MGIDETRTFDALAKFNAYSANPEGEKQVLKVCEDSNGRYLALVPKSQMSLFDRFLTLFNASNFNLTKVLDVANQAAQKDSQIENGGEILKTVSINLSKRVAKAHEGHTEQKKVSDKMVKIHDLVLTKTGFSALKKNFKEEALKQDIAQGPFRAVKPPAYDQLLSIWSEALVDTGLGKIVTQKIKANASPKEILEAIVTHIESNPDPRIKQVGEAMKEACDALIDQENKKPDPVHQDKRHIKDSTAFVVDMFMLRQPMKFLQAAFPKEPNKASPIHQEFAKEFKAYANQKAVDSDWTPLFDRLAVALTGSKPAVAEESQPLAKEKPASASVSKDTKALIAPRVQHFLTSIFGKDYKPGSIPGAEQYLEDYLAYEVNVMKKAPDALSISPATLRAIHFLAASIQDKKDPSFTWGMARDTGDCFFDAAAQGVSAATGQQVSYLELKQAIQEYARDPANRKWMEPLVLKDAAKGGGTYTTYEEYVENIGKPITNDTKCIIWGRPHIEGRIIENLYGVKISLLQAMQAPDKPAMLAKELRALSPQNHERFIKLVKDLQEASNSDVESAEDMESTEQVEASENTDQITVLKAYKILIGDKFKMEPNKALMLLEQVVQNKLDDRPITITGKDVAPAQQREFNKAMGNFDEATVLGLLSNINDLSDRQPLDALLRDPKNEFVPLDWPSTKSGEKKIYIAAYPGHFFPVFEKA